MRDGIALHPTLIAENADPAGFFYGALDMNRAAIQGYSMGGGSAVRVLITNPGYKCGFFQAPALSSSYYSQLGTVRVPIGFTGGLGDTVVSPTGVKSLYDAANSYTGFKFHYQFNSGGDHNNITASYLSRPQDLAVIARVRKVFLGFYDRVLRGNPRGLESVLGTEARSEAYLAPAMPPTQQSSPFCAVETAQAWLVGTGQLNTTVRVNLLGEQGYGGFLMAPAQGNVSTPFGALLLDVPSLVILATPGVLVSKFQTFDLPIPALPGLAGTRLWFQNFGLVVGGAGRLSVTDDVTIIE